MKKSLALVLALLMCVAFLAACAGSKTAETTAADSTAQPADAETTGAPLSEDEVRVFTLKGPTGMGMAKLMDDSASGSAALNYKFTTAGGADEFTGEIIQGNFEIAAVPTNLAAVLYAKTEGKIQVAAVNTLGVLYVLEDGNTINSVDDLEGKTIYSSGQGAVPEYALNYILDAFDINCNVVYEAEHDVVVSDLVNGTADIAILPEPKVTAAMMNADAPENLRVALDLNDLWKKACEKKGDDSTLYMGCVIVNSSWAAENPNEVKAFLDEYKASVEFVSSDSTAPELIAKYQIIPAAGLAKAALPGSKIVFITGSEMETGLTGFYNILYSYNPASVGGAVPGSDIYYSAE